MKLAFPIAAITLGALSTNIGRAQDTVVPLDFNSWKYFSADTQQFLPPASGVFEMTSEGLTFYGDAYRGSDGIETVQAFNLSEKTLYMRWKAHGASSIRASKSPEARESSAPPATNEFFATHVWEGSIHPTHS